MAFKDVRFPEAISRGAQGGPVHVTNIVRVNSGAEYRNAVQAQPLQRWDVSHAARVPADWRLVRDFHYIMRGRLNAFRFKDWTDYTVSASEGVLTVIDATHYQLTKRYTVGALTFDRPIYKPVSTIAITGGSGHTVNYATGVVTKVTGTPTAWAGQFDIPARFDIDNLPTEIIDMLGAGNNGFVMGVNQIPIVETRDIA